MKKVKDKKDSHSVPAYKEFNVSILSQPEKPFRKNSARALYWQRIQKFNGKALKDFTDDCGVNPPSMPLKGKLAGKPEPVAGWINWFVSQNLLEIT